MQQTPYSIFSLPHSKNLLIRIERPFRGFMESEEFDRLYSKGYITRINFDSFEVVSHSQIVIDELENWTSIFRDDEGKFTYLSFRPLNLHLKLLKTKDEDVKIRDMNYTLDLTKFTSMFPCSTFWSVTRLRDVNGSDRSLIYTLAGGDIDEIEEAFHQYCRSEIGAEYANEQLDSMLDRGMDVDTESFSILELYNSKRSSGLLNKR